MPIRFRCAYCNQLMGIARRKAGTVIRCPKCQGQVVVPHPVPQAVSQPQAPFEAPAPQANLFEQNDFPNIFDNPASAPAARAQATTGPPAAAVIDQGIIVGAGVFLSPGKIAVLAVGAVVLAGVAFLLGLLVGRAGS